jgi:hypothetical protein
MATSPLFGWEEPDDTDLVKDGAAAIRTLGNAIDTSMGDLLGGTTGQILSKNSNTNMDFTWVAPTTGDITGVTAGTGITGGGTSGTVTVSLDQANFGGGQFAAGKNKIINGDFNIWQRGTSFSPVADAGTFTADRFIFQRNGSGYTATCSRQTFTAGTAPVSGYEGVYFWRYNVTTAGTSNTYAVLDQRIENVQTFAGQTVTVSFWAKADASRTVTLDVTQEFGSGGSGQVGTSGGSHSVTTSWTRFSATLSIPSISGKTIGTGSYLIVRLGFPTGVTETIDLWGMQIEAGSTATPFQTASGSIAGELALCQRYYAKSYNQSVTPGTASATAGAKGFQSSSTVTTGGVVGYVYLGVTMRISPTVSTWGYAGGSGKLSNGDGTDLAAGSASAIWIGENGFAIQNSSGSTVTPTYNVLQCHYSASAEL